MKRTTIIVLLSAIVVAGFSSATGCKATDVAETRASIDAATVTLDESRARALQAQANAEAAGDSKTADAAIKTIETIDRTAAELAKVRAVIDAGTNPDGSVNVGGAIGAVAPLVPPPWNVLLLVGAPLLTGAIGEIRRRRAVAAAAAVVNSIDLLKQTSPLVKQAFEENTGLIHKWQGTTGQELVKALRTAK